MDLIDLPYFINNHNLFQSYYLKSRLTLTIDETENTSQRLTTDKAKQALAKIAELWNEKRERLKESEDNVIDFAKRVCEYLEMHQSGQGKVPRIGASPQRVDITLFSDIAALDRFVLAKKPKTHTSNTASRYAEALTVVEAEPLNANLDKSQHNNENPSYQITNYLTLTGLRWGILTDGVKWRIYHRFDPPRFDIYFEVNLQKILEISEDQERFEAFFWFYKFFSLSAFDSSNKKAFLDTVLAGSDKYAIEVQENLRNQAFSVVQKLAQGIATNYTAPFTDKDINTIYEAAIIILYRLLFIKYAEDMAILPVTNTNYQRIYGFSKQQDELLAQLDDPKVKLGDNPNDTGYWQILRSFFEAIDQGKTSAGIRGYNGSLFKPDRLASITIPDLYLAEAIDQLARVEIHDINLGWHKQRVDYKALDVSHLGSIYEGLLEQELEQDGQTVKIVNTGNAHNNDRRITGSFYTPVHIVDYIVKATLDPLCENKTVEQIEQIKILDLAMGSGHFLVSALKQLAIHHAKALKMQNMPSTQEDTIEDYKALMKPDREEVLASARILVERCLFGVDLNPLAVELAKLSLWLFTLSQNLPFSFLDHHLKVGNSLIGTTLSDLGETAQSSKRTERARAAGQLNLFAYTFNLARDQLLNYLKAITLQRSDTVNMVHQKDKVYNDFQKYSSPFKAIANIWLSKYFGNIIWADHYQKALDALLSFYSNPPDLEPWQKITEASWFIKAQEIAARERFQFFHWELEFPDVFFTDTSITNADSKAGFDVIIGNPPYDVLKRGTFNNQLNEFIDYVRQIPKYRPAISRVLNIFQLMVVQSLALTNASSVVGQIVPMSILSDNSASDLRHLLIEQNHIDEIQAFPQKDDENDRVFKDAKLSTAIIIIHVGGQTKTLTCRVHPGRLVEETSPILNIATSDIRKFDPENLAIPLASPEAIRILQLLYSQNSIIPFAKTLKVFVGEIDMTLDRDCVQKSPSINELLKGAHLQRYYQRVEPKQGQREWINVDAFKKKYRSNNVRLNLFQHSRVVFQGITGTDDYRRLKATLVPSGYFLANSLNYFTITQNGIQDLFVLALINSRLLEWRFRLTSTNNNVNNYEIQSLPFPAIVFNTPAIQREEFVKRAEALYQNDGSEAVLDLVRRLLTEPSKNDIVHDVLAKFADQMLNLHKHYQIALEAFMTDLEGQLQIADLDKISRLWTPSKKAILSPDTFEILGKLMTQRLELREHIGLLNEEQWKWLLKKRLDKISNMFDLVQTFRRHQPNLTNLTQRICLTDQLIDQIVYRLYGLEDEDISVIEFIETKI